MDELWYNYDLSNMKDYVKCIKQLEKICRSTLEYDQWQRVCKYTDNQVCPVCGDNYYLNNSKCESHHHPKTLFDIVDNIMTEHIEKNDLDEKTGIDIVQEIMDLHLINSVSYINLCQHCHKKYHAGHPEVMTKLDDIMNLRINQNKACEEEEVKKLEKELNEEIVIGNKGSINLSE